jgi:hypothetical protein
MAEIEKIISREEYEKGKVPSYDDFCIYLNRFIKLAVEEALRALPSVITHLTSNAAYIKQLSEQFYKENPDLSKHKNIVAQVAEKIEADNPGATFPEVLKKAAVKSRSTIKTFNEIEDRHPKDTKWFDARAEDL